MVISIPEVWQAAEGAHKHYVCALINEALTSIALKRRVKSIPLRSLLEQHKDAIAIGVPAQLRQVIATADGLLANQTPAVKKKFFSEAKRIFDYGEFSSKGTKGWNAYALCRKSKSTLCPYCQQAYAFTVFKDHKSKSFRPTLDHFFPKASYPYLALSLYNLIPACQTCNSSLKGQTDFVTKPHLHPLEDDECLRFDFDPAQYLAAKVAPNRPVGLTVVDDSGTIQGKNSIETFLLRERFECNALELNRFIDAVRNWTPDVIKKLKADWEIPWGDSFLESMLIGFDGDIYSQEMLGRIKRDLYKRLRSN
ncbi:MAG TPA: hypothetical protein VF503_13275 [Sphingobium sp.]|uniref:hypothetical protein n=1 Tax=Sphingobium sp. TaxID=1912891 RepID=UPI002ECFBFCF